MATDPIPTGTHPQVDALLRSLLDARREIGSLRAARLGSSEHTGSRAEPTGGELGDERRARVLLKLELDASLEREAKALAAEAEAAEAALGATQRAYLLEVRCRDLELQLQVCERALDTEADTHTSTRCPHITPLPRMWQLCGPLPPSPPPLSPR